MKDNIYFGNCMHINTLACFNGPLPTLVKP